MPSYKTNHPLGEAVQIMFSNVVNCISEIGPLYRFGNLLGSGQFGMVYKGVLQSAGVEVEVAVKTLKEGSDKEDRVKFLQEAAIMGQFKHPNVITMYGVVTDGEPVSYSKHVIVIAGFSVYRYC